MTSSFLQLGNDASLEDAKLLNDHTFVVLNDLSLFVQFSVQTLNQIDVIVQTFLYLLHFLPSNMGLLIQSVDSVSDILESNIKFFHLRDEVSVNGIFYRLSCIIQQLGKGLMSAQLTLIQLDSKLLFEPK